MIIMISNRRLLLLNAFAMSFEISYIIYSDRAEVGAPCVLLKDYNGFWAPAASLYWSSSSNVLVSRHPSSCIEEIISFYCPQCLCRYMEDEVHSYQNRCPGCFSCPCCLSILTPTEFGDIYALQCGHCSWDSRSTISSTSKDKAELDSSVLEKERENPAVDSFKELLESLTEDDQRTSSTSASAKLSGKSQPSSRTSSRVEAGSASGGGSGDVSAAVFKKRDDRLAIWRMSDLELMMEEKNKPQSVRDNSQSPSHSVADTLSSLAEHLKVPFEERTSLEQRLQQFSSCSQPSSPMHASNQSSSPMPVSIQPSSPMPVSRYQLLPLRVRLRTKRTVRCRKDVEEGKMSILTQPKVFPLEGDSSQKIHRGKWWVKDASAIHEIPSVYITKLPETSVLLSGGTTSTLQLSFSNPKDFPVTVTVLQPEPQQQQEPSSVALSCDPFMHEIMHENRLELSYLLLAKTKKEDDDHVDTPNNNNSNNSSNSSDSNHPHHPVVLLGAFEDELLIDDDDDAAATTTTSTAVSGTKAAAGGGGSADAVTTTSTANNNSDNSSTKGDSGTRGWSTVTSHNTAILDLEVYMPNYTNYNNSTEGSSSSSITRNSKSMEKVGFSIRLQLHIQEVGSSGGGGEEEKTTVVTEGKEHKDKKNIKKRFSAVVDALVAFPAVLR